MRETVGDKLKYIRFLTMSKRRFDAAMTGRTDLLEKRDLVRINQVRRKQEGILEEFSLTRLNFEMSPRSPHNFVFKLPDLGPLMVNGEIGGPVDVQQMMEFEYEKNMLIGLHVSLRRIIISNWHSCCTELVSPVVSPHGSFASNESFFTVQSGKRLLGAHLTGLKSDITRCIIQQSITDPYDSNRASELAIGFPASLSWRKSQKVN
jgi:hypothetical protein